MSKVRRVLQSPKRLVMRPVAMLAISGPTAATVRADAENFRAYRRINAPSIREVVVEGLTRYPDFRAVMYHRLSHADLARRLVAALCRTVFRPVGECEIHAASLGPGFYVVHGNGCYLTARSIGRDVTVHQQVTFGRRHREFERGGFDDFPTIGDRVVIGAGAKIIGPVSVGDDATIGANAVVVKDVPAGATVVAQPSRIL